jgi:hypothetical protein
MPRRAGTRSLVWTVLILASTAGCSTTASPVAGAASTPPSLAGSYTMSYWVPKGPAQTFPLTMKRDGHFSIKTVTDDPRGTWKESSDVVTLTTTTKAGYVFTIHQFGKNLGSKTHSGRITADGQPWAKWYAVRA